MLDNVKMDTEAGTTDDCGGVSGEPRNSQKYLQKSSKDLISRSFDGRTGLLSKGSWRRPPSENKNWVKKNC